MSASPAMWDSKTTSMIRSSPAPWTSMRSWTSSRAAAFDPPGIWSSSPTRVPSRRIFSWNSFSPATYLLQLRLLQSEHRRMVRFEHLSIAEIHMYSAWQAGVKASDGSHDVDALEVLRAVFFEDGCVLYGIFVGARSSKAVTRICIPRGWGIRMIVGDLVIADPDVVRKHAADGLVE